MRVFQAAALFAVPALTAPLATSSEPNSSTRQKLLTFLVPQAEDGYEVAILRLDVQESDRPCDSSSIHINGKPLSSTHANAGHGKYQLEDGQSITGEWRLRCEEVDVLTFYFDSFDGHKFSVDFPGLLIPLTSDSSDASDASDVTEEFDADNVADTEDCDTVRCIWRAFKTQVKATADDLREKVLGKHDGHDHLKAVIQFGEAIHEQPLASGMSTQQAPLIQSNTSPSRELTAPDTPDEALLSALFLALFSFSLFSLLSILYTHRQRIRTALAKRRTRAERHAAREARKQAIRDFFRRLFSSLMDYDAEKRAAEEERRRALAERQAEEGRMQGAEEETSMEQEIASLRMAADMVDSLVSGTQMRELAQQRITQPPPVPPRPSMSELGLYDDSPPTYEEGIHDSAVVADGFQYIPGAISHDTHSFSVDERSSDRLGYDK